MSFSLFGERFFEIKPVPLRGKGKDFSSFYLFRERFFRDYLFRERFFKDYLFRERFFRVQYTGVQEFSFLGYWDCLFWEIIFNSFLVYCNLLLKQFAARKDGTQALFRTIFLRKDNFFLSCSFFLVFLPENQNQKKNSSESFTKHKSGK